MKNIQDSSGASVKVPKREDTESSSIGLDEEEEEVVEISIEGIDTAVAKAKEEITKIIDEKVNLTLCPHQRKGN